MTATIDTGLHPTGMALFGSYLLVSNTYSDTISVIDTAHQQGDAHDQSGAADRRSGREHAGLRRRARRRSRSMPATGVAYVALYNANAIAVVDLGGTTRTSRCWA